MPNTSLLNSVALNESGDTTSFIDASVQFDSVAGLVAVPMLHIAASVNLDSVTELSLDADVVKDLQIQLDSVSQTSLNGELLKEGTLEYMGVVDKELDGQVLKEGSIVLDSVSEMLAKANLEMVATIDLVSISELDAKMSVVFDLSISLQSIAMTTLSADLLSPPGLRPLPEDLSVELGRFHTRPVYLVEVDFDPPIYLSSSDEIVWDGKTFVAGGVSVGRFSWTHAGSQEGQIALMDDAVNTIAFMVQQQKIGMRSVKIWKTYYKKDGTGIATPALEVEGFADAPVLGPLRTQVKVSTMDLSSKHAPFKVVNEENGFAHLIRPGTVLVWQGEKIVLE